MGRTTVNPADSVTHWPIDKLIPYARNSRTHSDEQVSQIAASIKEWGFTTAVLVDESGSIIAGHGRLMAARKLGLETVPVMVANGWTEAQKRAYVIADNRLAELAGWDTELLALELEELRLDGYDLDLTGFDADAIEAMFENAEPLNEMPELPDGDKEPFQQITFTLHDSQAERVKSAIERAKQAGSFDSLNQNSNGNAIARICEAYLS